VEKHLQTVRLIVHHLVASPLILVVPKPGAVMVFAKPHAEKHPQTVSMTVKQMMS
jgi:hypothetical protein